MRGNGRGISIQGLIFTEIVKFFQDKCAGVNGLPSVTVGLDRELELKLAENALYSYCQPHSCDCLDVNCAHVGYTLANESASIRWFPFHPAI